MADFTPTRWFQPIRLYTHPLIHLVLSQLLTFEDPLLIFFPARAGWLATEHARLHHEEETQSMKKHVHLFVTQTEADIEGKKEALAEKLFEQLPVGVGSEGQIDISAKDLDEILETGMDYSIKRVGLS